MIKRTPKEWIHYQSQKGYSYIVYHWKFDGRKKENKVPLKTKITLKTFEYIYCK